jgi:hypothetical protein
MFFTIRFIIILDSLQLPNTLNRTNNLMLITISIRHIIVSFEMSLSLVVWKQRYKQNIKHIISYKINENKHAEYYGKASKSWKMKSYYHIWIIMKKKTIRTFITENND